MAKPRHPKGNTGGKTPIAPAAQAAGKQIVAVMATVPHLVDLTPEQRPLVVKIRDGEETHIEEMARLGQSHPEVLPKGVDPGAMLQAVADIGALKTLQSVLETALQTVQDTLLTMRGHVATDARDIYDIARGFARRDSELGAAIQAYSAFLATGKRKPKPAPTKS